ncbi:hypothetical protein pb186bvf_004798 [Paramecium bursaria]
MQYYELSFKRTLILIQVFQQYPIGKIMAQIYKICKKIMNYYKTKSNKMVMQSWSFKLRQNIKIYKSEIIFQQQKIITKQQFGIVRIKKQNRFFIHKMKYYHFACPMIISYFLITNGTQSQILQIIKQINKQKQFETTQLNPVIEFKQQRRVKYYLKNNNQMCILNFINENVLICDLHDIGFQIYDYCPINNIVILPVLESLEVWDMFEGQRIIEKNDLVWLNGEINLKISQSGKYFFNEYNQQFLLNFELTCLIQIYDIDLNGKQLICTKVIDCQFQLMGISWIQEDKYIILDNANIFILIQVDIDKPIYSKYKKQQNIIVTPAYVKLIQTYNPLT